MESPTILLVEDNPDHEALALRTLRKCTITTVAVARDGAEALTYLCDPIYRQGAPPVGLVLLDLKLPRVDGMDVLRHLRARSDTADLPVVVLSSSDEERDIVAGYACGANSYLLKPLNCPQIFAVARQLNLNWLLADEASSGR